MPTLIIARVPSGTVAGPSIRNTGGVALNIDVTLAGIYKPKLMLLIVAMYYEGKLGDIYTRLAQLLLFLKKKLGTRPCFLYKAKSE